LVLIIASSHVLIIYNISKPLAFLIDVMFT